jgi:hypothetical protein
LSKAERHNRTGERISLPPLRALDSPWRHLRVHHLDSVRRRHRARAALRALSRRSSGVCFATRPLPPLLPRRRRCSRSSASTFFDWRAVPPVYPTPGPPRISSSQPPPPGRGGRRRGP